MNGTNLRKAGLESVAGQGVLDTIVIVRGLWLWLRLWLSLFSLSLPPTVLGGLEDILDALLDIVELITQSLDDSRHASDVLLDGLPLAAQLLGHHRLHLVPAPLAVQHLGLVVVANLALQPTHVWQQRENISI